MSRFYTLLRTTVLTVGTGTGLLLFVVAVVLLWPAPRAGAESAPLLQPPAIELQSAGDVQLLSSDDGGITFQVSVPWDRLAVEPFTGDGRQFVRLSMPGWPVTQQPGEPQLPFVAVLLGVPWSAELEVEAVPGAASQVALPEWVSPAPTMRVEWDWAALSEGDIVAFKGAG